MSPPTLHVLSPHPDDAAFSLGMTLARLGGQGWRIKLITCFSHSNWAPRMTERTAETVTAARRQEERAYAASLGQACTLVDLLGVDAPLRGHYRRRFGFIHRRPFDADEQRVLGWLQERLRAEVGAGPLLVPLALGDHIDHRLVREAALGLFADRAVGLYEELPYVIGKGEHVADRVGLGLGLALSAVLVPAGDHGAVKRRAICGYASQFDDVDARAALAHAAARGGGERLLVTPALARLLPLPD